MIHAAILHISMYGKLNQRVNMYMGDLLEILAVIDHEKMERLLSIFRETKVRSRDEWEKFWIEKADEETYTIRPQLSLEEEKIVLFND